MESFILRTEKRIPRIANGKRSTADDMNQILTIIKRNRQAVIAALICAVALSAAAFVFYYRQGIPAEAAFSLKNTLIGVVGFSTLFLYASEARLVKCEKEQFYLYILFTYC